MGSVRFETAQGSFEGVLDSGRIAEALLRALPISTTVKRWGEEIYFDVPIVLPNAAPTLEVCIGDIAYWPDGPCLCIFFGKTPASRVGEPRPASEVTVIGRTEAAPALLGGIRAGTMLRVERAGEPVAAP